ncbi:MAG: hypothetical protein J6S92_07840, partial [Oscillospiraceae bacterium]|nr:hypothetical protein [Oscillospiraceae bacterium]
FAALHFLIGFAVFGLMMYAGNVYDNLDDGEILSPDALSGQIFYLPWLLYAALELLSAVLIMLHLRQIRRYVETHVSPSAVKETLDWLPVGFCIGDAQGEVWLSNLKMNKLSQSLTQQHLSDSGGFWDQIRAQGIAQDQGYLLQSKDGHAYLFTQTPLTLSDRNGEKHYTQIIASDMTDAYQITQELTANNKHLKEVQYRMKAVAAYERSLIAAREVIKARTAVHNHMGCVLLSGKYYMDHPEGMDEAELIRLLEYNNFFLLREAENQGEEADALDKALKTAQRIRVTVEIEGKLPEQESARDILAQAVEQCAANTVRHAGGDCVYVTLTETGSRLKAVFRNNGKAPEQPVNETGGLLYLRKIAEAAGGTVSIQSEPEFVLTVCIPIQ